MRILITGSNGFIGKNLAPYLVHKGHTVEGYDYIDGRFPDPKEYDRVIHLGAISDTTEKDVDKILKQNYEFSIKMLELCDTFGTTFMYASSASVYGQGKEFKEQAIENGVIEVFAGSEDIYRDFIHVGDVCQILEKFLTVDATDLWNIGTGKANSFMYIAELMAKKWSAEVKEIPLPDNLKGQYQYHTQANIEKLSNTIGEYKFRPVEEFIL